MKTKVAKLLVLAVVLLSFSGCTLFLRGMTLRNQF